MLKIKKNDRVEIIKGKDKGKIGKVLRIEAAENRLYVEGINIIKKHTRQKDQSKPGGVIKKEGPIVISNVKLICPNCGKAARVGFEVKEPGVKVRICRKCKQQI
ncbi:MAG: 50S ribosomal protein L24 [Actinomycetota bacterium]|nr:50S ribosomal protein L24 [Actinomycetota bacterium]